MQSKAGICNNHVYSKFDCDAGRVVSNLNANSGRWCPVIVGGERQQMFIRNLQVDLLQIK